MSFTAILCVLASYFIGAVPFGYLVARMHGVDIFRAGSGNIGATNIGRVLGRKYGILVFALDFLKGAAPTAITRYLVPDVSWAPIAAGLAALIGHMFSLYLRFRGGKGVATGCGVVMVLMPIATIIALLVWLSMLVTTRYMSLASVAAAIALAAARIIGTKEPFSAHECLLTVFSLFAAILVIVRHRTNLMRLIHGNEGRFQDTAGFRMTSRVLHVLALGLWFGGGVFFTFVVALTLFHTFEGLAGQRPDWLPLSAELTKDQGTRLAGLAVGPIFPQYFAVQGVCGLVALITAWGWTRSYSERVHRTRFALIAIAIAFVLAGWPIVIKVEGFRFARYSTDSAVAAAAKSAFALWHTASLLVNFAVLGLVTAALALTAKLPADPALPASPPQAG